MDSVSRYATARTTWGRRLALVLLLLEGLAVPGSAADTTPPLEYRVKAAFLLNFAKFVERPEEPPETASANLVICVIGEDPFGESLDQLVQGEVVGARKIVVQRHPAPPHTRCDVAYISRQSRDTFRMRDVFGPGVLTVGEGEGFLRAGGIIAFVLENRRVRFDVSQSAARNASIRLSSRLLGVARTVEK